MLNRSNDGGETSAVARAAVVGLGIHDASIYSWDHSFHAESLRWEGREHVAHRKAHCRFDEFGKGYEEREVVAWRGGDHQRTTRSIAQSDGPSQWEWNEGDDVSLGGPALGYVGLGEIGGNLGRGLAQGSDARLAELMLESAQIELVDQRSDGTVVVAANVDLENEAVRAVVEIDTQHGFAPKLIQLERRVGTLRLMVMRMWDFRSYEGHWLAHGREVERYKHPRERELSIAERELQNAFHTEVSRNLAGKPVNPYPIDPEVVEAFDRARESVLGGGRLPEALIEPPEQLMRLVVRSINQAVRVYVAPPRPIRWPSIRSLPRAPRKEVPFYFVVPDAGTPLLVTAVAGQTFSAPLSIGLAESGELNVLSKECDINGTRVEGPVFSQTDPMTLEFRLTGVVKSPGFFRGWINLATNSEDQPLARVRVLMRVRPSWRASPAGIAVGVGSPRVTMHEVSLTRRWEGAPAIVSVRWKGDTPNGVTATLETVDAANCRIVVKDPQGKLNAGVGTAELDVLDESSGLVVTLPIAWCHLDPLSAKS